MPACVGLPLSPTCGCGVNSDVRMLFPRPDRTIAKAIAMIRRPVVESPLRTASQESMLSGMVTREKKATHLLPYSSSEGCRLATWPWEVFSGHVRKGIGLRVLPIQLWPSGATSRAIALFEGVCKSTGKRDIVLATSFLREWLPPTCCYQ